MSETDDANQPPDMTQESSKYEGIQSFQSIADKFDKDVNGYYSSFPAKAMNLDELNGLTTTSGTTCKAG